MRMFVSRAIVKFVPGGQTFTGEEPHPLDSRQEPLQGRGPVSAAGVIVESLDDQPHTLGFAQYQPSSGLSTPFVYAASVHWVIPSSPQSVDQLARFGASGSRRDFPKAATPERWRRQNARAAADAFVGQTIDFRRLSAPGAGQDHKNRWSVPPLTPNRTRLSRWPRGLCTRRCAPARRSSCCAPTARPCSRPRRFGFETGRPRRRQS